MRRRPTGAGIGVTLLCVAAVISGSDDAGKIMRPADGAALASGEVDIVATAPAGKLQLDGVPVVAEEPFPNVFHASAKADPGQHTLALIWEGGRKEVNFFVGENPPAEYKPFSQHPPLADVECTQCHDVSRRGRFRFKGGCFDCHQKQDFTKVHPHPVHILQDCGMCHNAHGSTVKAHLILAKELACKQCHN
jgi:predicted CXXCH cytochrome family protein